MGAVLMAEIADAVEIAKALGPTEETRAQFAKSWLGSSLGQTVVLLGLILTYVAILVLLWTFARGPLGQMQTAFGDIGFYALLAFFPAVIIAFNIIPAALKAQRERRLKRLMMTGSTAYEPGYFRLHPYGASDAARFRRNDGADVALRDWVRGASDPLLYLSGPSGSGKSSLIAASLEPQLRAEGWAIVNARLFSDPLPQIARAFAPDDGQPATPDHVYALMAAATAAHRQTQNSPMLLIIDQFEEHLILGEAAQQAPLQALLKQLARKPIDGLKLLLSLRSDYQALIFQQDLPPARSTINWFQLAPYRRGDAEAFLQSGGKQMMPEAIASLFKGLDRIEETRGLYRPISLNMIGLVLDRMGQTLEGDPETLIQSYLKLALLTGDTKDYVRPLLEAMISDAGTKIPQTGEALAANTGLARWQVNATMADLESRGLVRPLHGGAKGWEIAHDFLARLLGQMLGRLKMPLLTRARPYAAPVGLAMSMAALGFGVQYGMVEYQTHLRNELMRNGWEITAVEGGKFMASYNAVSYEECDKIFVERDLPNLKEMTDLTHLKLVDCQDLESLNPLRDLKTLTSLEIDRAVFFTNLDPLLDLTALTSLSLTNADGVESLERLRGMTSLISLDLSGSDGIRNLEPLSALTSLANLNLSFCDNVENLQPLSSLKSLTKLDLSFSDEVSNLEPLRNLNSLTFFVLEGADGIKSLAPLKGRKIEIVGASEELLATMR
jgi:hypothetical protein